MLQHGDNLKLNLGYFLIDRYVSREENVFVLARTLTSGLEERRLRKLLGKSLGRWLLEIAILAVIEFIFLMVMVNSFRVTSDTGCHMIEGTLVLFGGYSVYLIGLGLSRREGDTLSIVVFFTGLFFTGLGTYLFTSYQIVSSFVPPGWIVETSDLYALTGAVMIGVGIVLVIGALVGALAKRVVKK